MRYFIFHAYDPIVIGSWVIGFKTPKNAGIAIKYAAPAMAITAAKPKDVAIMGTSAAPITEKQPLTPHAHKNMFSFFKRVNTPMPVAMGKPIKNAGGAINAKQQSKRIA